MLLRNKKEIMGIFVVLHFTYAISTTDGSENTGGFHAIDCLTYGTVLLHTQCF